VGDEVMSLVTRFAIEVLLAFALAYGAGIGVYALGTFAVASSYAPKRSFGTSARALLREVFVAMLTQPFLLLFYFIGRRLDGLVVGRTKVSLNDAASVPIVFVHGYMQNRIDFLYLARTLGRQGFGPLYAINYPSFASIPSNAKRLARFVDEVCTETGKPRVDLVCHSMGGLVALEMIRNQGENKADGAVKVRKCVTLATPHAGVAWRGRLMLDAGAKSLLRGSKLLTTHATMHLSVPCLSVYSTHDNLVHPKQTSSLASRGGQDVEVSDVAHLAILFSPRVAEHVGQFLREPVQEPAASEPSALKPSAA
jgi:pimeloyl-ACP methyl ester carboxylesterase